MLADVAAGTVVVLDRYTLYDNTAFTGIVHQLRTQHLLRDLEGAGETCPDAVWPGQITDALRGLIHATNLARDTGDDQVDPQARTELVKTLRPSKIQQKISGQLTSITRTEDRYRVLGYLSTASKHGLDQFKTLLDVFRGRIWIPDAAAVT